MNRSRGIGLLEVIISVAVATVLFMTLANAFLSSQRRSKATTRSVNAMFAGHATVEHFTSVSRTKLLSLLDDRQAVVVDGRRYWSDQSTNFPWLADFKRFYDVSRVLLRISLRTPTSDDWFPKPVASPPVPVAPSLLNGRERIIEARIEYVDRATGAARFEIFTKTSPQSNPCP